MVTPPDEEAAEFLGLPYSSFREIAPLPATGSRRRASATSGASCWRIFEIGRGLTRGQGLSLLSRSA